MSHASAMQAESVRTGWPLPLAAIAAGALALYPAAPRTEALPPVADTDSVDNPDIETGTVNATTDTNIAIRDTARYVLVDLDGDGVEELVALGMRMPGHVPELVVMEAVHHRELARIPFGAVDNPCASDFTVDGNQLIVSDYTPADSGIQPQEFTWPRPGCTLQQRHHYRMRSGVLTETLVQIDF
jgi:hypothetical protein